MGGNTLNNEENEILEEKNKKKSPNFITTLILVIVVALGISAITSFFIVRLLTSNVGQTQSGSSQATSDMPIRVTLIMEGARYPMMLKGGYDIAIIDSLHLNVASSDARDKISTYRMEILEAIRMIFMNKTRAEISTPQGLELTKRQIRDTVNEIIGYIGERSNLGVTNVVLIVLTITAAQ